jgi:hypothetical protein
VLAQNGRGKDKDMPPTAEFDEKDPFTGELVPPVGKKRNLKKDGDAKQFLQKLGPDLTEQVLLKAGNLGKDTLEAGAATLEALLSQSDDLVSSCMQQLIQSLLGWE